MASPGELVRTIANVLGVPEASVVVHDRNLVVAGLRTKGGRGRSAAKMTPLDAANLLIGVAASSVVKETVETVNDYAPLPSKSGEMTNQKMAPNTTWGNIPPTWNLSGFPIPALQALPKTHTFRDALVGLIDAAADNTLREAIQDLPPLSEEHHIQNPWEIRVTFWGPYPQASLHIFCNGFSEKHHYSNIPTDSNALMSWSDEMTAKGYGDLNQIRQFSAKTIFALGELLNG